MIEFLSRPWPWYVGGALVGLVVPALLLMGNRFFGISSSLRHMCAACMPAKIPFFQYNWKKESWNLFFVFGIFLGGIITALFFKNPEPVQISESTKAYLIGLGIKNFSGILPEDIFGVDQIFTLKGLIFLVIGGFMVGFGTRYAGGCTSGHSIMGIANMQWPSLVATIAFMVGGIISTWFIIPQIFKLF